MVELDIHQGVANTFTAEDFSATNFDHIGERDGQWFFDNQPTATDHTNRRYGFNTDTEQWIRPFQYAASGGTNYYTWIATTQDDAPYLGAYDNAADAASHLRRVDDTYFDRALGQVRQVLTFTAGSDEYISRDWKSVGRNKAEIVRALVDSTSISDADKTTIQTNLGISSSGGGTDVSTTEATVKVVTVGTAVEMNPLADEGVATGAHGLGANPDLVKVYAECLTAEGAYEVGDRVTVQESSRITTSWDDTNLTVSVAPSNSNLRIVPEDGGASINVTPASWKLVATPYLFADQTVVTAATGGGATAGLEPTELGTNANFQTGDEGSWTDTTIDLPTGDYDFLSIRVGSNGTFWFSEDQISDAPVSTAGITYTSSQPFGDIYANTSLGAGFVHLGKTADGSIIMATDIDDDVPLGEIVAHSWAAGDSSSQQQQGVAETQPGIAFVRLYTTEPDGTTPDDPTALWRFDNGWLDDDLTPWYTDRQDAIDAGDSGDLVWVATAQFRREVDDGTITYHDGDWEVIVEWDVEYTGDDGATTSTTYSSSDTHIRFRKEDGSVYPMDTPDRSAQPVGVAQH